jgi:hypothetical protein
MFASVIWLWPHRERRGTLKSTTGQESVAEALARLNSLKSNLPGGVTVEEKYVDEFDAILDLLEQSSGDDLSRFRVPASELKRRVTSSNPYGGTGGGWRSRRANAERATIPAPEPKDPTDDMYCDRSFLMMKIDGLLGLFALRMSGEDSRIGFKA